MAQPRIRDAALARGRGTVEFFRGFLRKPELVGALIPSSRFVERRLVRMAQVATASVIVELGPGTGGTTRALLNALPPGGRVLAIEIDPEFAARLSAWNDPRLIVYQGSAADIGTALAQHGLEAPHAVVSGIPFSLLPRSTALNLIRTIWTVLAPGGRFVAYQYRGQVAALGRELLGAPERSVIELLNVPPTRFFSWCKPLPA